MRSPSLAGKADRITDLGRRVRFADWVHEFRKTLLAELDYRTEAENLDRFDEHFARLSRNCSCPSRCGT